MKLILFLITVLNTLNIFGQNGEGDSTIVTKHSDNFIEVQTLRCKLKWDSSYSTISNNMIDAIYLKSSLIPDGPKIKNGAVIIKDRNNNILKIKIYKDSLLIEKDEYANNILWHQDIRMHNDSINIDKFYFNDGKLQTIIIADNSEVTEIEYSQNGEMLLYEKK